MLILDSTLLSAGFFSLFLFARLDSSASGFQARIPYYSYHTNNLLPQRTQIMVLRNNPSPTGDDSDSSSQFSMPSLGRLSVGSEAEEQPRFKIGVLADIQYAPIPDGYSYAGVLRYYRHSLEVARHAAQHFETDGAEVVLNLGDIIDGKCQAIAENGGDPVPEGVDPGVSAVDDVLEALSVYKQGPILHTYGNHELYNLDREMIGEKLNIPFQREACGDLVGYWTHVHRGVRFVIIDSYDVAKMRRCKDTSKKYKEASNILAKENHNYPHNENSGEGLEDENRRFVAFNGGVGAPQLEWLRDTLSLARESQEKCIIISHQPILPGSSSSVCLIWNYDEVLAVLRDFRDVVVASFAGHAHSGGYKRDESPIHFHTFEAALENPDPHKTYGMVDVYDDCLVINGYGGCASACYNFEDLSASSDGAFKVSKVQA